MNNIQQNFIEYIQSNDLRKNLFTSILVFIALFLVVKTVLTYKEAVNYKNINNVNYISVNGKAEEYVKPDTLTFNINVNEEGKDTSEATKKVADKVNKAMEILKANGVKEENIKLQAYNIQDKYQTMVEPCTYPSVAPSVGAPEMKAQMIRPCGSTSSKVVGQIVTQNIEVKIPDIEKNADNDMRTKIIDQLSTQNIKADNFNFTIFDVDSIKKELRAKAIQNAKEDAKKLTRELGVRIDNLSNFSENGGVYPMYGMGGDMAKSARSEAAVPSAPELTPGQEKITVEVTLTYSIK